VLTTSARDINILSDYVSEKPARLPLERPRRRAEPEKIDFIGIIESLRSGKLRLLDSPYGRRGKRDKCPT